ncbi:unnamed protein product, partial [Didymodactylos carnosus]
NKKDCDIMVAAMQHIVEHQQTEEHQPSTSAQAVQPKKSVLQNIQSQAAATSKAPSSTNTLSLGASLGNVLPQKPSTTQSQSTTNHSTP